MRKKVVRRVMLGKKARCIIERGRDTKPRGGWMCGGDEENRGTVRRTGRVDVGESKRKNLDGERRGEDKGGGRE